MASMAGLEHGENGEEMIVDAPSMVNVPEQSRSQSSFDLESQHSRERVKPPSFQASDDHAQASMQLPEGVAVDDILKALENWADAVQASSEFLDKRSCAKVVSEIMQVHKEITSETYTGDATILSMMHQSVFPKRFIETLRDLGKFNDLPLKECVAMAFDIEFKMSEGAENVEDRFVAYAQQMATKVDQKREEYEARRKEVEDARRREQMVADRHKVELNKSKQALLELKSEEERVKRSIAQVNAEIARQKELVERLMQEGDTAAASKSTDDARPSQEPEAPNMDQPELRAVSLQLNVSRTELNRALQNLSVSGDQLSLICHMADFFKETQEFLKSKCNEVLVNALQKEHEAIKEDKEALTRLMEHYKARDQSAIEEEGGADALSDAQRKLLISKYKQFFTDKVRTTKARHAKLRHAAAFLVLLTQDEPGSSSEPQQSLGQLSRSLISSIDQLFTSVYRDIARVEVEETQTQPPALSLVLYPKDCLSAERCSIVVSACLDGWRKCPEKAPSMARVDVSSCEREEEEELQELRRSFGSSLSQSSTSNIMGCLFQGIDSLCSSSAAHAAAIFSKFVGTEQGAPGDFLPLSFAILYARTRYSWLGSVLVLDAIGSSFPDALLADADVTVFGLQDPAQPQEMRKKLEGLEKQMRSCQPQLVIVSFEGESSHRHASSDFRALGSWLVKFVASSPGCGRLLSVWNLKEGGTSMRLPFTNFMLGVSER
ncbi:hypothetical protein GUITHDRAFT_116017 [Guillardia theta CCMP2712]|uniref:Uncharacterized protein n=1 Tax=Guillardia theta (strain CCMP2712) TaxID=905079 RepID=L1IPY2_GUITC|nr:hypothetical protein GUITHDRAFT_116017 [Guillardia theta CCMP2712]EKX37875.1 hypothetical protein GUITHDRAFT_116017 [Guillardia theta CCMP2712]|mmetsp:Transcript_26822/g.87805  ORF Transcript_26822/g.87805 Transcript_26822/m.87805 type:complete len:721 (-) Transcript_26822:121-2283(-)|eukprot:XP_005824855.1 hypothetical protein GUITHDRAFT_116017 [Guillardia theta CCMP2712]